MSLRLETSISPNGHTLQLAGVPDIETWDRFEDALGSIDRCGPARVTVDLREVTEIDSAGLGALLRAVAWSRRRGVGLAVVRPPAPRRPLAACDWGGAPAPPQGRLVSSGG